MMAASLDVDVVPDVAVGVVKSVALNVWDLGRSRQGSNGDVARRVAHS